jgi:adenosylmethionine-8-amino-7-oxononanoate aminotransferase
MYGEAEWAEVRRLFHREGVNKARIARQLGMSRTTVQRLLGLTEPPRYVRTHRARARQKPQASESKGHTELGSRAKQQPGRRHSRRTMTVLPPTLVAMSPEEHQAAATQQMQQLAFMPSWGLTHEATVTAAAAVAGVAPGDLNHVFFVSSGSEAVESALKLARTYHLGRGDDRRTKVIAREWSYHGTTLGALSVTGVPRLRAPFAPMLWDGVHHVPHTLGADDGNVDAIEAVILAEGPDTVSAVILEPVQNGRGALVPPPGYWARVREICDRHGVLLVADEVICGFGRLGHWFGVERVRGAPDLITFAKGATSAYVPLGGLVASDRVMESVQSGPTAGFVHGATFGGHPTATAVATATVEAMAAENVNGHVLRHEGHLDRALADLHATYDVVEDVRGCGYFRYLELTASRAGSRPLRADQSAELLGGLLNRWMWDAGLIIRPDDRGATMLAVAPPLICGPAELDDLADKLARVLDQMTAWLHT